MATVGAAGALLIVVAGGAAQALDLRSLPPMDPGAVIGLVLSAAALWFSRRPSRGWWATVLAGLAGVVGALSLVQIVLPHAPTRIARLVLVDSEVTGACLVLFALGASALPHRRPAIGTLLAVACGAVAGVAIVSHAYGLRGPNSLAGFSEMPLPEASAFVLLAVGLLFTRPERGLVGFANRDTPASALVRRLVPWAVAVPVVAGWLLLTGGRAGLYSLEIGIALLALVTVGLLLAVIAWTARGLAAMEQTRRSDSKQAEQRFRAAVEASPSGILMVDEEGGIVLTNREAERVFGYGEGQLLGRRVEDLVPERLRDRHRSIRVAFHAAPTERPMGAGRELVGRRKDDSEFPVEISLKPVRTPQGVMVLGSVVDVSERRRQESERASLQRQLMQAQRLESVGRLAGGVAHDFNNVLGVIRGYAELMAEDLGETPKLVGFADEILKGVERASGLTRQLLAFSRQQVLLLTVLDVNDVVRRMHTMLGRLLGADIELVLFLDPDTSAVRADSGQLEQVLMNLAVNAQDAMPDGGRLTIETADCELDEAYAGLHPEVVPGPYVRLTVSDSGVGMDAETKEKIFDPFFTTKPSGRGTGLGLATVHGIVRQSGGHVYVYSEPGCGSSFKVYLPATGERPEREPAAVRQPPAGGHETILVVEDEQALCTLARTGLEAYGYTVLTAERGGVAREICEGFDGTIDLLLTDVVLPDTGGRELAVDQSQKRTGMKVLYMSGYTNDAIVRHGVSELGAPFIQKPFSLHELARRVRQVLDAPSARG